MESKKKAKENKQKAEKVQRSDGNLATLEKKTEERRWWFYYIVV